MEKNIDADFNDFFSLLKSNLVSLEVLKKMAKPSVSAETLKMWVEIAQRPGMASMLGLSIENVNKEIGKFKKSFELSKMSPESKNEENRAMWWEWYQLYIQRLLVEKEAGTNEVERGKAMQESNPRIVLRNHIAQRAIERAEEGDFDEVQNLLQVLMKPYEDCSSTEISSADEGTACSTIKLNQRFYSAPAPAWAADIVVT